MQKCLKIEEAISFKCLGCGKCNLKFMDVVERWPGSAHDATIFSHSNLRIRFEEGHFPNSVLLGNVYKFPRLIS